MSNETKIEITQPVGADVRQELSRLTATVANLTGPPTANESIANPIIVKPLLDIAGAPPFPELGWTAFAANQLNSMAAHILHSLKAQGYNPKHPLLPVAQAALDLSAAVLNDGSVQRAKAEELAKVEKKLDNAPMNDITREELSARLELVESKADARMSRFEERIDSSIGEMRRNTDRLEGAIGNLKTTTVVTAVASVLSIVLGVAAFNATVLSNMVASFESGKNTATAISESTKRLEVLQDRIEGQQNQTAPSPVK